MQTIDTNAILLAALNLVFIYVIAAMLAVDGWVLYRLLTGRTVFPPAPLVPQQSVPWGALTVLLMFVLSVLMPQVFIISYLMANGLMSDRSPATARVHAPAPAPDETHPAQGSPLAPEAKAPDAQIAPDHGPPEQKLKQSQIEPKEQPAKPSDELSSKSGPRLRLSHTELLALHAVGDLVLLAIAPLILRMTSRSPFRDLGLCFNRWWLQAGVGVVAFLAIQPSLMATQATMMKIWESHPHPLIKLVNDEFSPGVPQLAILLAVIVAPMAEELVYRGIIQSWLVNRTASALNGVSSLISRGMTTESSPVSPCQRHDVEPPPVPSENPANPGGTHAAEPEAIDSSSRPPEFHTEGAAPIEPPPQPENPAPPNTHRARRAAAVMGITMTSLIFAALHFDQWPAPIALFLLSVVIGYVYERTGSLIAAICMHAAFNGLSTFLLLSSLLVPQSAHHPKTEKVKQPAPVAEISSTRDCACIHSGK
jgi:membrane protease YdiL (CAAX protease family)